MKDKSIANLLARHGMPPAVAEAFKGMMTTEINPLTGNIIKNIWNGTQAQYDAIAVKDDSTLYVIVA